MISLRETDLERELTQRLAELAESDTAPSGVDATQARRAGVRKLRLQRATMAGSVAAVAATVAGVLGLGSLMPSATMPAASGHPSVSASHNPLVTQGDFGWLPASLTTVSSEQGDQGPLVVASTTDGPKASVSLIVYNKGAAPRPRAEIHNFGPGPKVNGRTAFFETGPSDGSGSAPPFTVRWRAMDGRWIEVSAQGLPMKLLLDNSLVRIAEHVRLRERAVPFFITGVPRGTQFRDGEFRERLGAAGKGSWSVKGSYHVKGHSPTSQVAWTILPAGSGSLSAKEAGLRCTTERGLDLCVSGTGAALKAFGGISGFLHKFTLLSADKETWTTDVVR